MRRLLVLLTLLLVAACGGGGDTPLPLRAVADAPDATERAQTARFSLVTKIFVPDRAEPIVVATTGGVDLEHDRAAADVDMSGIFATPPTMHTEYVVDWPSLWMRLPEGHEADVPAGTEWVHADLSRLAGEGLAELLEFNPSPDVQLQLLRTVTHQLERVGEEKVRGVETTHFRGELDLLADEGWVDAAPAPHRDALRAQLDRAGNAGVEAMPVDVWLDGAGRLRRMKVASDLPTRHETTLELWDFGAEVVAEPPPAGKVAELPVE